MPSAGTFFYLTDQLLLVATLALGGMAVFALELEQGRQRIAIEVEQCLVLPAARLPLKRWKLEKTLSALTCLPAANAVVKGFMIDF